MQESRRDEISSSRRLFRFRNNRVADRMDWLPDRKNLPEIMTILPENITAIKSLRTGEISIEI